MATTNPFAAPQTGGSPQTQGPRYKRIGGWLILIAFGLALTPVVGGFGLLGCFTLISLGDDSLPPGFLAYSIVQLGGLSIAAIVGLVLMFRRSRVFPKYMICMMAGSLLLALGALAIGMTDEDSVSDAVRSVISSAIWIPYFIVSKRVKGTFVE
jgi:hypothetical protein